MTSLRPLSASFVLAAGVLVGTGANAQPQPAATAEQKEAPRTTDQPAALTGVGPITLKGCLSQGADNGHFVLRGSTVTSSVAGTTGRSTAAGLSATGDAPSGSIDGKNPTGSTATEIASSPTPATGTPGAAANPASPTYNQETPAGTSGTVTRPDTSTTVSIREYVITAPRNVNLKSHVGHLVEITGQLTGAVTPQAGSEVAAEVRGPSRKEPTPATPSDAAPAAPAVTAQTVHRLSGSCDAQ